MKVKIFRFLVSNYGYRASDDFKKRISKEYTHVSSEIEIQYAINYFLEDVELVDIKINTVDIADHNNGGSKIV
jgi:hypothetical protein